MDFKRCPECSGILQGTGHKCPPAVEFSITSTRFCAQCGVEYSGETHGCTRAKTVPSVRPDATPTDVIPHLQNPERRVSQYVLVDRAGRGGMGEVWKAWDTRLTRWVAIKFLTLSEEDSVLRFQREARLAAQLRHPNIAPVFEVGDHAGKRFIAMEYIEGLTLDHARLPPRLAAEVMAKVARGVHHAHELGVIHRDLKPSNIMVTRDHWPYVMDFGLARRTTSDSSLSQTGDIMGTPAFMAPEQARAHPSELDARADVYGLGATFYTILTGEHPFRGETPMDILLEVMQGRLAPPRERNPKIPEALDAITLKAMARERDQRYESALAMALDLERYLAGDDVAAHPPTAVRRVARKVRRNLWPAALGLVLVAAIATFFAIRAGQSPVIAAVRFAHVAKGPSPFEGLKDRLSYEQFRAGQPAVALSALDAAEKRDAAKWLSRELAIAYRDANHWRSEPANWPKMKDPARRLSDWCEYVASLCEGEELRAVQEEAGRLREMVGPILAYEGQFTLRILVADHPTVRIARTGSASVQSSETPCFLRLDIADYEVEIGSRKVRIDREQARRGEVWIRGERGQDPFAQ